MRSAKALPLSVEVDALAELSARCEVQRRELHDAARVVAEARTRERRDQRQLAQLKARLELADERVARLEEEAASAYALTQDREARAVLQLEQELAEERAAAAQEIANLRDALAAALERERAFRRVEADLRRRLVAQSSGGGQNTWEPEDARATLVSVDSDEVAANGLPLVP